LRRGVHLAFALLPGPLWRPLSGLSPCGIGCVNAVRTLLRRLRWAYGKWRPPHRRPAGEAWKPALLLDGGAGTAGETDCAVINPTASSFAFMANGGGEGEELGAGGLVGVGREAGFYAEVVRVLLQVPALLYRHLGEQPRFMYGQRGQGREKQNPETQYRERLRHE
jgi:hypothetical protein